MTSRTRFARLGAATAAVTSLAVFATGCGSDSGESDTGSTSSSATAAPVTPVPPSPVETVKGDFGKLAGYTYGVVESEDAFMATLQSDPCSATLTGGIEAILQNYQKATGRFGVTINPGDISISGAAGMSAAGMPQCTYTVTGAGDLETIRFASSTIAGNTPEPGRLQWQNVIAKSISDKPEPVTEVTPQCRSTDEFLKTVQEMGPNPAEIESTLKINTSPLIATMKSSDPGKAGVQVAATTSSVTEAQLKCGNFFGMALSREFGQSPDWLVQATLSSPAEEKSNQWQAMARTTQAISRWVSGGEITDEFLIKG